jgi:hypothetical protein
VNGVREGALVFRMKHTWRAAWGGSDKSRETPLWKPR